ncbi:MULTISPECIES: helix-turn-helix domain-containing protein [unclassified Polynucleobacter]|uniref:hypothetical protein n=1 Tax=unclassified Polynucleobacter TaxID=2640945 RepID=UPI0025732D87|nr:MULTISPECIES: hypothetical protein [unclassified Polynucleobacter]BEI43395.1 hypothetical protein PHIN10_15440 [Polynucleobacter sp. HIN10]BEI45171.1 hypothetical protein PHIN11_15430 [Polynucleobacter sp. HIN11]
MDKETEIISKLFLLRGCDKKLLPIANSLVAYDLLLQIVIAYKTNQSITVKSLFSSLPHSYTAIRHHYKRLLKEEWIKHRSDDIDARVKYIEPTDKLIKVISGFTQYADTVLNSPPPPPPPNLGRNK